MAHFNPSVERTALLVIDVQESFRQRPYFVADEVEAYLAAQNRLIAGFVARGLPVVRVFHVEDAGAFSKESGFVRPFEGLQDFAPALAIEKHMHSAFAGTPLGQWLTGLGVRRLVVSGIRTEQCCETTTRDASDRGFAVDYVTEATLTFPMQHANGRIYSAAEIRERTELVLSDRFASIVTVDQALDRVDQALNSQAAHAEAA